jgi:hypothetical protein
MNPHPMSWFREDAKKNRFFYSAFIHSDQGSSSDFLHSTLLRGLEYIAGFDTTTSLLSAGNSIRTLRNLSYITGSRELRVGAQGPHRLEILSARGKTLERLEGEGPASYRPAAFAKAGVYYVRYQGKGARYTQRILVY